MLNDAAVAQARRIAKCGTAAGLSGTTCEHYKLLLDDAEALELFTHAANLLVAARVPANVAAALALLTALRRRRRRHSYTGDTWGHLPSPCVAQPCPYVCRDPTGPGVRHRCSMQLYKDFVTCFCEVSLAFLSTYKEMHRSHDCLFRCARRLFWTPKLTVVSPLTRTGHPHPCTVEVDGAALRVAERRKHCTYPELARGGPQKLLVLGSEIGGRWNTAAQGFLRDLVRLRALRAPPAVRAAASSG